MSRVAIVTGGASGMGRATVELLERRGVVVAVFDVQSDVAVDPGRTGSTANTVCFGAPLTGETAFA